MVNIGTSSPLKIAAQQNNLEMFKLLIQPCANEDLLMYAYDSVMAYNRSMEWMHVLFDAKVPVWSKGVCPLEIAMKSSHSVAYILEMINQLDEKQFMYSNYWGMNIWQVAARHPRMDVFEHCISLPFASKINMQRDATVSYALMNCYGSAIANKAIEYGFLPWITTPSGTCVLHNLYSINLAQALYPLVKDHLSIDELDSNMNTPLLLAVSRGSFDVTQYLLENGANVNYQEPKKRKTALTTALESKHIGLVQLLLQHKADPNTMFMPDSTTQADSWSYPIIYAAYKNLPECLTELLKYGANVNATTLAGKCAIASTSSAECRRILFEHGAKWNISASEAQHVLRDILKDDSQVDVLQAWMDQGIPISKQVPNKTNQCQHGKLYSPKYETSDYYGSLLATQIGCHLCIQF